MGIPKFLVDNAAWAVPVLLLLLGGIGWLIKRAFQPKASPSQTQQVKGGQGVQAGRDATVGATKRKP